MQDPKRILVIRRDNIGDLLCTTPMISALRGHFPAAEISILANSYNAPVLKDNPDIDYVYAYTKAKHSEHGKLRAALTELRLFWSLRQRHFDLVIHANPVPHPRTARLVRFLKPGLSLGVISDDDEKPVYTLPVPASQVTGTHHVERVFSLLKPLGVSSQPGAMTLNSSATPDSTIGIHLSSRKPCNRWPLEHYIELITGLTAKGVHVRAFWAPGSQSNAQHPGDDELAEQLGRSVGDALELHPTATLEGLIDGLAKCRGVICCDGGALHIAAALGKPMITIFGCTNPDMWGPWQVPHVLFNGNGQAANISAEQILTAASERFLDR